MKLVYFDCFAGASGDMILGALLDAGAPEAALRQGFSALGLDGAWRLEVGREPRNHIMATRVRVEAQDKRRERGFAEIRELIAGSPLAPEVKRLSIGAFARLATVEGQIHGRHPDEVHFHEVGALDSIIDIVGAAILYHALGVEAAWCSAVTVGFGTVECRHGVFPVPAPATLELLKGAPLLPGKVAGEMTTPTGAALLKTFCGTNFGAMPPLRPLAVGYGAGSRQLEGIPNLLRAVVGEAEGAATHADEVALLETNVDDMNPQLYGPLMARLFEAGALDTWLSPVQMKKDRPGTLVSILCDLDDQDRCARILFEESTTLGVRMSRRSRLVCFREVVEVETPLGKVAVKLARDPWGGLKAAPEMESVRRLAELAAVPLREAWQAASEAGGRAAGQKTPAGGRAAGQTPAPIKVGGSRNV
ncbi:MAG: nickel pincer cofactor biosynthesis protein LarC [Pseudomonadota bacterium]